MAFPQSRLDTQLHFKFDGINWTDATPYLYAREDGGVSITRGRSDWSERTDPGVCSFQLDNRDGRFSPRNPLGPYYGQIGRNTPVRVSVNQGTTYLDIPASSSRATTPDGAAVDILGDIDIRVDYYLNDWDSEATATELCGKWRAGTNDRSWMLTLWQGRPLLYTSPDGIAEILYQSTVDLTPPPTGRIAIRATVDVDNGAAGKTATFYTAPTIAGPWTQLGAPVTTAGTTSLFNSSQAVDVGAVSVTGFPDPVGGKVYGFQLRNGIDGTVVANPDFTVQAVGTTPFADAAGRTWSFVGSAAISNRKIRFMGEVPEWPLDQDITGNDVWIEVEAAGRLRRLKNNTAPLQSALRRRAPSFSPLAYWPMEEGNQATSAAGLPQGVSPLTISTVNWASVDTLVSSDPLPTLAISSAAPCRLNGQIPAPATTATEWSVVFMYRLDVINATQRTFLAISSQGTVRQWLLQWSGTGTTIIGKDKTGANVFSQAIASGTEQYNAWVRVELQATQNGANVDWHIGRIPVGGIGIGFDASFAGTVGRPTNVTSPDGGYSVDLDGMAIGHISAWSNKLNGTLAYTNSDVAWAGETAKERFVRMATEESLSIALRTDPTKTEKVGGQRSTQLYEVLQDTADVDNGILMENREAVGLLYRDRIGMENQTPRMILAYPQIQAPLKPADDDQATKNVITVTRSSASSYTASLDSGRMSKLEFPNGVGPYPDEVTLPLYLDADAADQAGWRLHQGTVDEARYPVVNVWLQRSTSQLEAMLAVDSGDRIQITSPNVRYQYDTIDLIVQGYTEFISQYRWEFQLNCTPASPWNIAKAGSPSTAVASDGWAWADTIGSTLAEDLTDTETITDVTTTAGPVWTSNWSALPFLWTVGGETVRVDALSGFTSTNPYFDANTTSWSAQASTITRDLTVVHPHPNAIASLKVTPDGSLGSANAVNVGTAVGTIQPGTDYKVSAWVYSPNGHASMGPAINWHTSADAYISTSSTPVTVPAGVWTYLERTFTAPATASIAHPLFLEAGAPVAADVYYLWNVKVGRIKASMLYDNFGRTSTDTWADSDSGMTWVNNGTAADYDVLTGFGRHTHPAASVGHHSTTAIPHANQDLYVDIAVAALSTGASQFAGALLRYTDIDNLYEARVEFTTANAINLTVRKRVATVETQLGSFSTGFTAVAGTYMRVRFQINGTALKAKIWPTTAGEPPWLIEVTDAALAGPGSVGVKSVRNAGNTNANAIFQFDNLDMINPQRYVLTRSYNGVVKAQPNGADLRLRFPAIAAL